MSKRPDTPDLTPVEPGNLDHYLKSISPEALGLLMAEIEHARRNGADGQKLGEQIIESARKLAREGKVRITRSPDAKRLFFSPLDPFLVDGSPGYKQSGRIERGSLDMIYRWIERDLMHTRLNEITAAANLKLRLDEAAKAAPLIEQMRLEAAEKVLAELRKADTDERERMRIAGQVGSVQALEDARDMVKIFSHRAALETFSANLPDRIAELSEDKAEYYVSLIEKMTTDEPGLTIFALAVLMHRLDKPAQIIRLAIFATNSDLAEKLRKSPLGQAADLIHFDIDRIAALLKKKVSEHGSFEEISGLLFRYYALAHGLRVEAEIEPNDPWAARLSKANVLISDQLGPIIASAPRHIKAALVPRRDVQIQVPDEADLVAAEFAIGLMQEARLFISELALNDLIARTSKEVDQYMSMLGEFIVDRLRDVDPAEHKNGRALLIGAVRLTRLALGHELADLLNRAGNMALNSNKLRHRDAS